MGKKEIKYGAVMFAVLLIPFFWGWMSVEAETEEVAVEEVVVDEPQSNVPFAHYFQQYASLIDWDWRLLAALCYHESRFNPQVVSPLGASGLMQLMPRTAYRFGLNDSTLLVPEDNIRAGVLYIKYLDAKFSFVENLAERQKFVIASYNAGPAHIMDARRLARRYGANPQVWYGHTALWLERLQYEEYATDSVVRFGQFNPREPLTHVDKVLRTYQQLLKTEPDSL